MQMRIMGPTAEVRAAVELMRSLDRQGKVRLYEVSRELPNRGQAGHVRCYVDGEVLDDGK